MRSHHYRLGFLVMVCVTIPTSVSAQVGVGTSGYPITPDTGPLAGPGSWGYAGLGGGPYVTYPYVGFYGTSRGYWSNGLSLYGPPVPTYGPIPGVFGSNDLNRQYSATPGLGLNYGWVGLYAASPRPRVLSASAYPIIVEPTTPANPGTLTRPRIGGCLYLSVKVPQPATEVFVDGKRTVQRGTDRLFESPVMEAGKECRYELIARWMEAGIMVERKRVVTGKPGEVIRVDFLQADEAVVVGK